MRLRQTVGFGVFSAVMLLADVAGAGTINITARESYGAFYAFAGSGARTDTIDHDDTTTALTGGFSFGDSGSADVAEELPFSYATTDATGAINISDLVTQTAADSFTVTADRTATGAVGYLGGSGAGNATIDLNQSVQVTFDVVGDDAIYSLTGSYDPGTDDNTFSIGNVALVRPASSYTAFDFNSATTFNETGTLAAGNTYRLDILLRDYLVANQSNTYNDDASNLNLTFTVTSVPEPAGALLLGVPAWLMCCRRRKA